MIDTTLSAEKQQQKMIASRTSVERLKMACSMFETGKRLMRAGLQNEKGLLSEAQLRAQMFVRLYGESFTPDEIKRIVTTVPDMQLDT